MCRSRFWRSRKILRIPHLYLLFVVASASMLQARSWFGLGGKVGGEADELDSGTEDYGVKMEGCLPADGSTSIGKVGVLRLPLHPYSVELFRISVRRQ